jgi:hypothetical protein
MPSHADPRARRPVPSVCSRPPPTRADPRRRRRPQWDKKGFLAEVAGDHKLKHVETDDRSGPKIEEDVHIKPNPHGALLQELKSKTATQE